MKKSLKALLAATALLSFSALATPPWQSNYQQGMQEFTITGAQGTNLTFSCDQGGNNPGTKNVFLRLANGQTFDTVNTNSEFDVKVDGKEIYLYNPTSRVGLANWTLFWEILGKTKSTTFTITMAGKSFTFPVSNAKAVFKSQDAEQCIRNPSF